MESESIPAVTGILLQVSQEGRERKKDEEELLRATLRCLAHFTHGCGVSMADKVSFFYGFFKVWIVYGKMFCIRRFTVRKAKV